MHTRSIHLTDVCVGHQRSSVDLPSWTDTQAKSQSINHKDNHTTNDKLLYLAMNNMHVTACKSTVN